MSLWEIAHYQHDHDPRVTKTHRLPLNVRDTLLALSISFSKRLNIRGEQNKSFLFDIRGYTRRFTTRHYRRAFKKSIDRKIFGKRFFSNMFLTRSQLAKWCIDNKEPLPKFWFHADDKHPYDVSDENLLEEMSADGRYMVMLLYDDRKPVGTASTKQSCTTTVSSNAIKAAKVKHAPRNAVKDRFINFCRSEGSKHVSRKAAATHFFDSLNKREQFLFNSRETATRAFLEALRKQEKQR